MQRNKEEENRYRQLLSLATQEFMALLSEFDKLWQGYHRHNDLKGEARMITKFQEHAHISLRGSQEKRLFILVYLQQNPTQAYHGVMFSMN